MTQPELWGGVHVNDGVRPKQKFRLPPWWFPFGRGRQPTVTKWAAPMYGVQHPTAPCDTDAMQVVGEGTGQILAVFACSRPAGHWTGGRDGWHESRDENGRLLAWHE